MVIKGTQVANNRQTLHIFFYVHVSVHLNKFLCNKTNYMAQFHRFLLS